MKRRSKLLRLASNKTRDVFKWLYPGMGVKRWIIYAGFGVILIVVGSSFLRTEEYIVTQLLDVIAVISGIIILILGIKRLMRSLIAAFVPVPKDAQLMDLLYQRKQLSRGPRVVTIGGGTGLSVLLSGLKEHTSNITAVVTVADDGGSSGRLRQQFDMLPPGDIRNCLVALADASSLMRDLFQFRFKDNSELNGHSFGNLFITVMTQLTGDFDQAIKETSKVLALRGQVIPSTLSNVRLVAQHKNGQITEGEYNIPRVRLPIEKVSLKPSDPRATPEALKAIEEAQIIILGPGSLYTSILPNLLIKDIANAVIASSAVKVYVCNVMTQPGETDGYSASEHIKALIAHTNQHILDYCIMHSGHISSEALKRYEKENAHLVVGDKKVVEKMGYHVVENNAVTAGDTIRHDPEKLAKIILGILEEI
ncbi:MAG: YvcK family protein [Candidatus Omnitrophica bacterium]|nr:YvcK family protein [Candidatus Omnitrophota bacterium]